MKGLVIILVAFLVIQEVLCQQQLRKRKIRKKKIKQPVVDTGEPLEEEDRNGRGFLDEYYSKYAGRTTGMESTDRMDSYDSYESEEDMYEEEARNMPDYSALQQMQMQAMMKKQEQLQLALQQKKIEEQMIEAELEKSYQNKQIDNSNTRYVQHVALPNSNPDEKTYMYSTISLDDPTINEVLPARSVNNFVYAQPPELVVESSEDYLDTAEDKMYGYSTKESEDDVKRFFSSSDDSLGEDTHTYPSSSYSSGSKDAVSRFFGVTGTTSQDIQLGLTFTVPFLSIPLTSLQSALGGGGLSGIFDNFNFDVSSLVSIVVIVMLAIFVLPQVIYWLTGVNLSAFNWGRSDDEHGINMANLVNMVDESLLKYDVDTKSCMARTMCNQYAQRMLQGEEEAVQRMSRGIIENIAHHDFVKKYLGEGKVNEALKYGKNGKDCSLYYSNGVCPWDTSAMIKIASKIMTSGNVDFASIATAAASKMIQNSMS